MAIYADGTVNSGAHNSAIDPDLDTDFTDTNGFTYGGWFRFDNLSETSKYALGLTGTGGQCSIIWGFSAAGEIEFFSGNSAYRTSSQITIGSTGWHHIIYRCGAGGRTGGDPVEWCYFLNGSKTVINASFDSGVTNLLTSTDDVLIGNAGTVNVMTGAVEEVYFWPKALSDDQIGALASGMSAKFLLYGPDRPNMFYNLSLEKNASGYFYDLASLQGNSELDLGDRVEQDGPGLIYPVSPFYPAAGSAAPPATSAALLSHPHRHTNLGFG